MYIISEFYPSRSINSGKAEDRRQLWQDARCGKLYSSDGFKRQWLVSDSVLSFVQVEGEYDGANTEKAFGKQQCSDLLDKYGDISDFHILELRNRDYGYTGEMETEIIYLACFRYFIVNHYVIESYNNYRIFEYKNYRISGVPDAQNKSPRAWV